MMELEGLARRLTPKLLLTTGEVAAALDISLATVREMLECGALSGVNLAASSRTRPRWYVYRSSVFRMMEERKSGT